jgi:hypothetical protein
MKTLNTEALTNVLTVRCFREDCPSKDLASAVFSEVIDRLQNPFTWRLRRWCRSIAKGLDLTPIGAKSALLIGWHGACVYGRGRWICRSPDPRLLGGIDPNSMVNSYSVSAGIGVICGQVRIRLGFCSFVFANNKIRPLHTAFGSDYNR